MPYNLIVILAPKIVRLDEEGDIIANKRERKGSMDLDSSCSKAQPEAKNVNTASVTTIKRGSRGSDELRSLASDIFQAPATVSCSDDTLPNDIEQGNSVNGGQTCASPEPPPVVHEVNLRTYLMEMLTTLHQQEHIITLPTVLDDETGNSLEALCVCERSSIDMIIAKLAYIGVGSLVGSVNVIGLETCKYKALEDDIEAPVETKEDEKMFLEVASQIRVEQIVEIIEVRYICLTAVFLFTQAGARFSFDYLSLLIIASTIAGIGLATNNTVAIVASMLVSPIMGPVLALTFGTIINDWKLMRLGLATELSSLLLCICIGYIIGICCIFIGTDQLWPTDEMRTRGLVDGLAVGLAIAVPSGIGVALSVLGNNTSSLVGVAISASLLPPAVNCGLAFAYAALGSYDPEGVTQGKYDNPHDYVSMGGISLSLTLINIGAIYISAMAMFRLKEVAPMQNKTAFWQTDIKISRRINNALHNRSPNAPPAPVIKDDMYTLPRRGLAPMMSVGDVLSTARADKRGHYQHPSVFDVFEGYQPSPVMPSTPVSQQTPNINLSDVKNRFKSHAITMQRSKSTLR